MARMMKETKEKIEKMLKVARNGDNGWLGTDMPISIATAKRYPNIFTVTHEYRGHYEYDEEYDEEENEEEATYDYYTDYYIIRMTDEFIKNGFEG